MGEAPPARPTAAERLAAAAALLCAAVAVALVLLGVARNVLAVVGAGLSLLVCVASGWYVVSRHGRARLAAVSVMAAALALVAVALLAADVSILRVTLAGVLAALSVAAARYALRRTPRALGVASRQLPAAVAAGHSVLIMNLKSGGGKAGRFRLAEECRDRDIEPVVLQVGDDLRQLAEDAVSRGADVLGMAGGDGSQALVAAVAARHDIAYVCVPAGTRNHFALDLGLDRDDVIGALDAFAGGYERRVDLASVNGRTFVNNASLGLYADVVESPQYRDAKIKTAASKLPDLLGPDAVPVDLPFTGPDGTSHPTAQLILVSNNPYQLANAGGRGTRKHIDRGVLGIVTARITGAAEASRFAALEVVGQVRRFTGWLEWTAREFEIRSAGPVRIGVDGETIEMAGPLKFESQPLALRVRMPQHAIGISPAGRAVRILARSTITQLAQVTSGAETASPSADLVAADRC
ncbi:MAG: diacylglycerol kinase family protein [Streptosporangiaceae bacterium]